MVRTVSHALNQLIQCIQLHNAICSLLLNMKDTLHTYMYMYLFIVEIMYYDMYSYYGTCHNKVTVLRPCNGYRYGCSTGTGTGVARVRVRA